MGKDKRHNESVEAAEGQALEENSLPEFEMMERDVEFSAVFALKRNGDIFIALAFHDAEDSPTIFPLLLFGGAPVSSISHLNGLGGGELDVFASIILFPRLFVCLHADAL